MRLVVASLVAAFLGGCGIPPLDIDRSKLVDGPPGAEEAEAMLCESLGVPNNCPPMYFQAPDPDRCIDSFFYKGTGHCDSGITGSDGILLVMPTWATKPSDTSMAHEMIHWARGDYDHERPEFWGDDHTDWPKDVPTGVLVGDLSALLVDAGL